MADRDRFGESDRDYAYTDYSGRRGLDVRNPGDYAIQRAYSYPSNRQPLLNQPPMAGPPQRPHVNPRMRHINPRGMNQNYGGKSTYPHELQHQGVPYAAGMYGGRSTGEEAWESEKAKREKMMEFMQGPLHPNPRMRGQGEGGTGLYKGSPSYNNPYYGGMGRGLGSTNEYQTSGLWQDWKRIFERTGNAELADYWIELQQAV